MDRGAWQATAHRVVKELDSTEVSLFSRAPKSLQMVMAAMKLKRCLLLGRKAMTNLVSILKNRNITLLTKVHLITDGKSQLIGKDPDAGKD